MNLSAITAYRAGFYSALVASTCWAVFQFIAILLLTSRVKSVYGWTRNDLLILTAANGFIWGIFHCVFARNFSKLSRVINLGQLDNVLARPIDSQFLLSVWVINFTGLVRTVLGFCVLIYMLSITHTVVTLVNIISFLILGFVGLILIYSIWFTTVTILIWNPRLSNLIDLLYYITGVSRFPPEMIFELKSFLFFILIPFTFVMATPTKVLLHKLLLGDVAGLFFFAILIFSISRIFWKFALRSYTSAGG